MSFMISELALDFIKCLPSKYIYLCTYLSDTWQHPENTCLTLPEPLLLAWINFDLSMDKSTDA